MIGMKSYYISRAVIAATTGALLALSGAPWWMAILLGLGVFGWFLWAPRSGRYSVHPEFGVTALRRDERTQIINDKAARNAFIISMLSLAGMIVYFGTLASTSAPIAVFRWLLILGVLSYYVSDFWLRRKHA